MHKILLCLYGAPRPAIPTLMGRSGQVYGRAHFNEKEMRHQCGPFDLDYYHKVMLPDISQFRNIVPQRWFAVVQLSTETVDVSTMANDLDKAKARIIELETRLQTQDAPLPVPDIPSEPSEPGERQLSSFTVRELRQMVKDRNLELPHNSTKDQLIGILEGAVLV